MKTIVWVGSASGDPAIWPVVVQAEGRFQGAVRFETGPVWRLEPRTFITIGAAAEMARVLRADLLLDAQVNLTSEPKRQRPVILKGLKMDPLNEAKQGGYEAANRLLADAAKNRDLEELVEHIRTAARTDSKFNWHLIEAVASLAVKAWEDAEPPE